MTGAPKSGPRRAADKRMTPAAAATAARDWRAAGETVVAVRGAFDVLHAGHLRRLQSARAHGTRLLALVLDDDAATSVLGAPPALLADHRATVVAGLGLVDGVVVVEGSTHNRVFAEIEPVALASDVTPAEERALEARVLERLARRG